MLKKTCIGYFGCVVFSKFSDFLSCRVKTSAVDISADSKYVTSLNIACLLSFMCPNTKLHE